MTRANSGGCVCHCVGDFFWKAAGWALTVSLLGYFLGSLIFFAILAGPQLSLLWRAHP